MNPHASTIVREVISSTSSGADVMSALPGLVRQLLDDEAWREFAVAGIADPVRHDTFTGFVSTPPPRGLGGKGRQLLALCGVDDELRERVQRLLDGEMPKAADHGGDRTEQDDNVILPTEQQGNSREYTLRRLKRDHPELAAQVIGGSLSANAAAIKAGFRRKTAQVPIDDTERLAAALRRQLSPEQLAKLIVLLIDHTEHREAG